jgi:branched-chain amino acid transport system permease protein
MYFTIATIGFTLSLQVLTLILSDWTGGSGGISPLTLAGGDHDRQLIYITGFLLIAAVCSDIFLSSRFRPAFFMIRSNSALAAASGVPVVGSKILAFVVSGSLAGLAGESYAALYGYVVPTDVFILNWSIVPIASAILGGCDSTFGPVIGSVAMRSLEEAARAAIGGVGYQVVYGVVIIVCIVLAPMGLTGLGKGALKWFLWRSRHASQPASAQSRG